MGEATTRVYEGLSRVVVPPLNSPAAPTGNSLGVIQVILLHYDADEAGLVEEFRKSQAVYAKINPEASMRLLFDEIHGGAVGRYRIHILFPGLTYFAEAQGRERASEEWQELRRNGRISSTRTYEGLSRVLVRSSP
jgi:hypothetical protein